MWQQILLLLLEMLVVVVESRVSVQSLIERLFLHRLLTRSDIGLVLALRLQLMLKPMNFWWPIVVVLLLRRGCGLRRITVKLRSSRVYFQVSELMLDRVHISNLG